MTLQRLNQLSLVHLPQLNRHVSRTRDEVGGVTGELTIPHPPQVAFKSLMLGDFELPALHVDFKQLDLLVGRASGHELVVGRYEHFQDIVFMGANGFRVGLQHVLAVTVNVALVVPKHHPLHALTHRYRTNAIVCLDLSVGTLRRKVPPHHHPSLVSSHNRALVRVQIGAVYRLVVADTLGRGLTTDVEHLEVAVLTGSVNELLLLPETPHRSHIALELSLE